MKKSFLSLCIIACTVMSCNPKKETKQENTISLSTLYQNIINIDRLEQYDSLEIANKAFQDELLKRTSIEADELQLLKDLGLEVVEANDKMLTIFSWDTYLGGTMIDYDNVFWYQTPSGIKATTLVVNSEDAQGEASFFDIQEINDGTKTYYLALNINKFSVKDVQEQIRAFSIVGEELELENPIFVNKNGEKSSSLEFNYDFFSVLDNENLEHKSLEYNKDTKTITFPETREDGEVLNKVKTYTWNGKNFVEQ